MRRCLETAEILYPGIRSEIVPDFRECDFGTFEYKNYYDYQVQNGCGYILEEDGSSQAIP